MTTTHYYAPPGGLPPQTRLTTDRAIFTEAYVVIPRGSMTDIVTSRLPFWDLTRLWVLARPLSGFAETFSQYLVEVLPGGGSDRPELDSDAEGVLFVVAGGLTLTLGDQTHALATGGYAYLPPGQAWTLHNTGTEVATFHWIRKNYRRVEGIDLPDAVVTNEADVPGIEMPGTNGAWTTQRFIDLDDMRHDLQGKAVYLLNNDWVEVQEGDFMWLRAFCPQACYAGGPGRFRYLLYKDINRHMPLGNVFA